MPLRVPPSTVGATMRTVPSAVAPLAAVTLTDVRRVEPDFPIAMGSPPAALIAWPFAYPVGNVSWRLQLDLVSCVGSASAADVIVTERTSNGARLTLATAADDVVINYQLTHHGV